MPREAVMFRRPADRYTIYGAVKLADGTPKFRISEQYEVADHRHLSPAEQAWVRVFYLREQATIFDVVLVETTWRPAKNTDHWRPVETVLIRFGQGRAWFEPNEPCDTSKPDTTCT